MPKTTMPAEIKEKIIQMRLDGVTWKEINEKLNLAQNAHHSIYKAPWFIKGMTAAKQKRREAIERSMVSSNKKKKEDKKDSGERTDEGKKKEVKAVDKEIEKHIKGSDKAPATIKKKEVVESGKTKETEEKKKNSFGLWAILIIALVIGVVVVIFLLKGKKAQVKEGEEEKPKTIGFEGRTEEEL